MSKLIDGKNINWKELNKVPELDRLREIQQPKEWHDEGNVWNHTMLVTMNMLDILELNNSEVLDTSNRIIDDPKWTEVMLYAALFHDVGKADTYVVDEAGSIHFPNHAQIGSQLFEKLFPDYQYKAQVSFLIKNHMDIFKMTPADIYMQFKDIPYDALFLLKECDLLGSVYDPELQFKQLEQLRELYLECKDYQPSAKEVELEFVGTYTREGFDKANKILGKGCPLMPLSVGYPFKLDSGLTTDPVTKILNESTFRVGKQLYKINSLC